MDHTPTACDVFRKVLFLTLFGFLALLLAGPVIAVVSVILSVILSLTAILLPFFLVGLMLWLPFQTFVLGQKVEWHKVGASAKALFTGLFGAFGKVLHGGVRTVQAVGVPVGYVARGASRVLVGTVRVMASTLVCAFLGALLGGSVGILGGMMHNDVDYRLPMGMLVGASVGVVFGLARWTGRRQEIPEAEAVDPIRQVLPIEGPCIVQTGLRGCVEVPAK